MNNAPPATIASRPVAVACWTLILLSAVLTLVRLMHAEPLGSANDRSRWCTVRSLVELGTYRIDKTRQVRGWDTIDLVRHNGHFYSSKPPLLSTIVAGLYWTVRQTIGWTFGYELEATTRLILLVLNVVPMVIALALLARLIRETSTSALTAIFVTAAASFGTLLMPFLTVLNNHTVAATSVVFALYPLVRILQGHDAGWRYALVGFWAAFTCCNELPAAAFGVALFALLCWKSPGRTCLWFVPTALVPLGAYFYTNYLVTGGWKPFYAYYGTETYLFVFEGVPSYWMHPRGLDANRDGFWTYLLHCTLGHHGLLSLSPVFLFTLLGWTTLVRQGTHETNRTTGHTLRDIHDAMRPIHWVGLSLSLIVFAFFMTRTNNYNYGGISIGLRWMLWLIPFWLLAIVPALDRVEQTAGRSAKVSLQSFAWLALAVSAFSAWYPLDNPWQQPWLFTLMEQAGWIDYSEPQPKFDHDVRTWISQLPSGDAVQSDYWIELQGDHVDGSHTVLRLDDGGPAVVDGQAARVIRVSKREHGTIEWRRDIAVSVTAFAAGEPPAQFVLWPDGPPSDADREFVQTFLGGLPGAPRYVLIEKRYLKVPLRTDAFHTERAYAQLHIGPNRCRREVWFSNEAPFGIIQVLDQVTDPAGAVIFRQDLAAVRAGTMLSEAGSSR
jgi:hypothetical protein